VIREDEDKVLLVEPLVVFLNQAVALNFNDDDTADDVLFKGPAETMTARPKRLNK